MRKKALAALLAFALALAGNSVRTAAAILPGGSSQDVALREAALLQNIEDVKDALKKGANANAPSATPLRTTPLSALAVGLGWHHSRDRAADLAGTRPLANSLSVD